MSEYIRLSPEQIETATAMWNSGEPEFAIAAAINVKISTLRRRRGDCLAGLQPRGHSERDSGRRVEEMTAPEIYERAARIRTSWNSEERQLRALGRFEGRPASPPAQAGPFPKNHGLRICATPRGW
jgi:hypothetical protein